MKKLKFLFIIMLLFVGIQSILAFDNTIKVYDYAQILSEKEEINLKKQVNNYINNYNMDMVLITVKYYTQSTTDEYINAFYNKNNFGKGISKDGVIVAIDLKENNISIKTFGKAFNYYSDGEIKNILNQMENNEEYYDKLNTFISYSTKYKNEFDTSYIKDNNFSTSINWLSIIIPSIIIPTIIIFIGILKNKNVKKEENANYYIKSDSVVINTKEDKFVTTNTKKTRINNK